MASFLRSILVSMLFTLFGGPGILLVYVPWRVTGFRIPSGEPLVQIIAGFVLVGAGRLPLLESVWRFIVVGRGTLVPLVPTEHPVVKGFYRYLRNPMYIGVVTAIAGEALLFWRRGMAIELVTVWVAMHLFVSVY